MLYYDTPLYVIASIEKGFCVCVFMGQSSEELLVSRQYLYYFINSNIVGRWNRNTYNALLF